MEMRNQAVRFVEAGQSRHAVAERLGVSVSCIVKWMLRHQATGSVAPGKDGCWKTLSCLVALRSEGVTAPWPLNSPIDCESVLIYVRDVVLPTLRLDDIMVMDNIGSHKAKIIRQEK